MSEVCERNDAHASCPNNIIRLGGVALWFSSSFAILSFHSIPSDRFLQFMFSMQMFAVYPVSLSYSLKKSFRFAFVFSVSGLYDVIIRIRSFSMFSAATLILNLNPPFRVIAETKGGTNPYFITGAGGVLQAVMMGFGGLAITDGGITQEKQGVLPPHWKALTLKGIGPKAMVYSRKR